MKVRKFLFAGALIVASLFSVNSVMAQTTSDNVTVNLKFQPVQSIVVTGTKEVDLVYANKTDYSNGKSATVNDHLEIFSTGGFVVTVKADNDFTSTSTGAVAIPAEHVKVKATKGSGNNNDYGEGGLPEVTLSTSPQNFIASETGGTGLKFNVIYDNYGGAGNAYIDKYIHPDVTETVYAATVTYTIATN
jgi:hypothetical protein